VREAEAACAAHSRFRGKDKPGREDEQLVAEKISQFHECRTAEWEGSVWVAWGIIWHRVYG